MLFSFQLFYTDVLASAVMHTSRCSVVLPAWPCHLLVLSNYRISSRPTTPSEAPSTGSFLFPSSWWGPSSCSTWCWVSSAGKSVAEATTGSARCADQCVNCHSRTPSPNAYLLTRRTRIYLLVRVQFPSDFWHPRNQVCWPLVQCTVWYAVEL